MSSVFVRFRNNVSETITEEEADKLTEAFGRWTTERSDNLVTLPSGRRIRISDLVDMQMVAEQPKMPLPIEEAMAKSAADEADPEKQSLKQQQMAIFKHNSDCIRSGRMDQFFYYKIERGKIVPSTKEEMEQQNKDRTKKDLLAKPGVHSVIEREGTLSIVRPG